MRVSVTVMSFVMTSVFAVGMLVSCSSERVVGHPAAPPPAAGSRCEIGEAPLARLHPEAVDEPNLAIPQPPGWSISFSKNSELIRGIAMNEELRSHDFTPNAVVTLEDLTGAVSTPAEALDAEGAGLIQNGAVVHARGSQCGYPSQILNYELNGRSATTLVVAAKDDRDKVWAATVGMQTAEPNNPEYLAAKRMIMDGFQFVLPNAAQ